MPEPLPDRLAAVADVAAAAGRLAADWFDRDYRRWEKTPGNPVCEVDLSVDALIRPRLMAIDPEAGWLSEETADDAARLARRRLWVVDPIDGTRDYIRGRTGWAVSIALIEDGRPVIGVLDAPLRGERWYAAAGHGATLNGETIGVMPRATLAGARVPADHLLRADRDLTPVGKPNSIALRMAMVAAGQADLVASVRWGNEWDVAAAALIVAEAGGVVSDAFGRPLVFNQPEARALGLLATTRGIHAAAVERLRDRAEAVIGG